MCIRDRDIFDAAEISLEELPEEEKEHASKAGRLYARTGGVSQAVEEMVRQLSPDGKIGVRCEQANGTKAVSYTHLSRVPLEKLYSFSKR